MCNDQRELWLNRSNFVDRGGKLRFETGKRTGFGGENAPHGFGAKPTRATNHSVDMALDRAGGGYPLQDAYRKQLAISGEGVVTGPEMSVRRATGCCVLRERRVIW